MDRELREFREFREFGKALHLIGLMEALLKLDGILWGRWGRFA